MPEYRIVTKIDPSGAIAGGRAVKRELSDIESLADRAKGAIARAFGALAVGATLKESIVMAREFTDAMAEISTQIDETKFDMAELTEVTRESAKEFGSPPVEQAKAFYEIISAGAKDSADAIATLNAANKLAVGGITTTATAADILTSSLNSYGGAAGTATDVSDALFIAVRNGKTTVEQLSGSLGRVTPLAAQAGVSFDELTSSVAALTQGGLATSEAVTAVRGIIQNVLKPTAEAREQAKLLGIEFNATALRAKGLQQFLQDVTTKTKGNSEALGILFGDVQALTGVLALGGEAGKAFAQTLTDMEGKAGATQAAFDKIAASPGFQIDKALANIKDQLLSTGLAILTQLLPALVAFNENFDLVIGVAGDAATAIALFYTAVKAVQFASFISGLITATAQMGTMIIAANGGTAAVGRFTASLHLARAGIALLLTPANIAIGVFLAIAAAVIYQRAQIEAARKATGEYAVGLTNAEKISELVTNVTQRLAIAVGDERTATLAAAQSARAITIAHGQAAVAALRRAQAEATLARSMAVKDATIAAGRNSMGAGGAILNWITGTDPVASAKASARADANLAAAEARVISLDKDLQKLDAALAAPPPVAPPVPGNVPIYRSGEGGDKKDAAAAKTTFAEIERGLMRENELLGLNGVAREIRSAQFQAAEQLERNLSDTEGKRIETLIREGDAMKRGAEYQDQLVKPMEREIELLKLSGVEREIRATQLDAEKTLGKALTDEQKTWIDQTLREIELRRTMSDLLRQINGPLDEYKKDIAALNKLLAEGSISQNQFNIAVGNLGLNKDLQGLNKDLGGDFAHQAEMDAVRQQEMERQQIIWEAREAGLLSDQQFEDRRLAIQRAAAAQSKTIELERSRVVYAGAASAMDSVTSIMKDAFGEQSRLYRAAFIASKAFAIAESIVKIQQGIANAAALPFPANIGAMVSVAAATASIVSNIKAITMQFEKGGFTGNIGRKEIAGVVHGQEFVVNADATRRNRPALEAMNKGQPFAPANDNFRLLGKGALGERRLARREQDAAARGSDNGPRVGDRGDRPGGMAGGNRSVHFHVTTPDADSFRRSERQMYNRANEHLARAQQRRR